MAKYSPEQFTQMRYDVYALPDGASVLDAFPRLKVYKEFTGPVKGLDKNKIIRYICYCYDKSCEPMQALDNIFHRRYEAALLAGFEADKGKRFDVTVEKAITCQNKQVNEMIVRFLRDQADDKFAYLAVLRDAFYAELPKVQKGDLENAEKIDKINKRIEVLTKEITRGDDSRELELELYQFMERERLNMRPEDVAEMLRDGKEVFTEVANIAG